MNYTQKIAEMNAKYTGKKVTITGDHDHAGKECDFVSMFKDAVPYYHANGTFLFNKVRIRMQVIDKVGEHHLLTVKQSLIHEPLNAQL